MCLFYRCRGTKFVDLMAKSEIFEGSVIRCIRRLEELVTQLASVSKVCAFCPLLWHPSYLCLPNHPPALCLLQIL